MEEGGHQIRHHGCCDRLSCCDQAGLQSFVNGPHVGKKRVLFFIGLSFPLVKASIAIANKKKATATNHVVGFEPTSIPETVTGANKI
jgi:hypothetical protein